MVWTARVVFKVPLLSKLCECVLAELSTVVTDNCTGDAVSCEMTFQLSDDLMRCEVFKSIDFHEVGQVVHCDKIVLIFMLEYVCAYLFPWS